MKSIGLKGASGLGDSIYCYPIAREYSKKYDKVYLMSNYPELFATLPKVEVCPHQKLNYITLKDGTKHPVDIRFTYCGMKYTLGTSQFEDSYRSAKLSGPISLSIPWKTKNKELINTVKEVANGRKICVLAAPYEPFGRDDQWGKLLRVEPKIMQDIVDTYSNDVLFVQIGNEYKLHDIKRTYDISNKITVSDLMDLVHNCDIGLSQIGNLLPMCESQGKDSFIIYSRKALESDNRFIAAIKPEKVTHYSKLNTSIIDDCKNYLERFNETLHA